MFRKFVIMTSAVMALAANSFANNQDYCEDNYQSNNYNSSVESSSCCNNEIRFNVDLLYWRALETGFNCGCGGRIDNNVWDPGVRIGLDWALSNSCWNILADWTHFNTRTHKHHGHDNRSHWKLDLDLLSIRAAYDFCLCDCFSVKPFIGIYAARVDQKVHSRFREIQTCESDATVVRVDHNDKAEFHGIGPQLGLEADWNIGCGYSLYGNLSTSILYGRFHTKTRAAEAFPDDICFCSDSCHEVACQAVVDAGLGIKWNVCLCQNLLLNCKLGLEHHRFFNHNRIGCYGDLCLDGAVFSIGTSF